MSVRRAMAVAAAGAAAGAFVVIGSGAAEARADTQLCEYSVTARDGLNVHELPNVHSKIVGVLKYHQRPWADCRKTGFTEIRGNVPVQLRHGFIDVKYLHRIRVIPTGGVETGAGGTSAGPDSALAAAGLATVLAGGGIALAARRRATGPA
uniref:MYXO-CTERM domain-containing protein n=1 Tax=Actinomadura mexicana TaxID=134959 RepID=A0A239CZ34_9ACTN|nr:hypothetical protein [Actinomadura mexicana]SNS25485.1 hypothetical protein SAMN06265355_113202 [Actinomadura mexicana]